MKLFKQVASLISIATFLIVINGCGKTNTNIEPVNKKNKALIESINLDQLCKSVESVQIPQADHPEFSHDNQVLNDCSSGSLYYGLEFTSGYPSNYNKLPIDYVKARKCAILETSQPGIFPDEQLLTGNGILMAVYANGYGVKQNLDLAIKYACTFRSSINFSDTKKDVASWIKFFYNQKINSFDAKNKFNVCDFVSPTNLDYNVPCGDLNFEYKCSTLESLEIPRSDYPNKFEEQKLADCSSTNAYYGIGESVDYIKARKCALIENEQDGDGGLLFNGPYILMMIYANGYGVKQNTDLAIKMACNTDDSYGAPAERAYRFNHLSSLKKGQRFDYCDDITSGDMMGRCSSLRGEIDGSKRKMEIDKITSNWPQDTKEAFKKLTEARDKYIDDSSNNEVDQSGTARSALISDARNDLNKDFFTMLESFEVGKFTNFSHESMTKSKMTINQLYQNLMHCKTSEYSSSSGITKEGVAQTQQSWEKYKKAWIEFGKLRYPQIPTSNIEIFLIQKRIAILDNLYLCD